MLELKNSLSFAVLKNKLDAIEIEMPIGGKIANTTDEASLKDFC